LTVSKYSEVLLGLHAKAGKLPITSKELAEALGVPQTKATAMAAAFRKLGYLEPGPVKATYYVAVEMIPPPKPAKVTPKPSRPRPAARDGSYQPPDQNRLMGQDWTVLAALDDGGPCTVRELRRRAATSFNVGPSLERLALAGLVAAEGLVWRAT
jgi:hypothetical protein